MSTPDPGATTGAVRPRVGLGRLWPFLVAGLLAAVDLAIKVFAEQKLGGDRIIDLGFINLRLLYNTGVSFSFGADLPTGVVAGVTGALILGIATYLWKTTKTGPTLPLLGISLVLGGALGNFLDRLDGRGVVDYLHSGWFPTFNLADVWVTLGVALIVLASFTHSTDRPA